MLLWTDINDSGNDHALAVDDLSIGITAVPEPHEYGMVIGGMLVALVIVRRRRSVLEA